MQKIVKKDIKNIKYIIGIDEVGRGPLAGPVAVGAFCVKKDFKFKKLLGIRDSKKLTPEKREYFLIKILELEKSGEVEFAVSYVSAKEIDKIGISSAIKKALKNSLNKINKNRDKCSVFLDGGLYAPEEYKKQKTIIKGDDKIKVISCASVVAKVLRDRLMCKLAKKYPKYGFEIHKGYGTKKHCESIRKNGICSEHRKCFLKKILTV
ncbi:MAG: ribonuclease HII [Candidatus Paceibacterota bacterium]